MSTYSIEHELYLKKKKRKKQIILFFQISILISFIFIWQILADFKIINTFLFSSPKQVIETIIQLINENLFTHIKVTTYETIISFLIASGFGLIIATTLWLNDTIAKIIDPYLTVINSLPKVALGPLIIIWVGASTNSIIFMALMISLIISIINIYNAFTATEKNYITLLKSMKANKWQIFTKVILPSNKQNIINKISWYQDEKANYSYNGIFVTSTSDTTGTTAGDYKIKLKLDDGYVWNDSDWMMNHKKTYDQPVLIYELHMGSWKRREDGTFYSANEVAPMLIEYLKQNYTLIYEEFLEEYIHISLKISMHDYDYFNQYNKGYN